MKQIKYNTPKALFRRGIEVIITNGVFGPDNILAMPANNKCGYTFDQVVNEFDYYNNDKQDPETKTIFFAEYDYLFNEVEYRIEYGKAHYLHLVYVYHNEGSFKIKTFDVSDKHIRQLIKERINWPCKIKKVNR